MDSTGQSISTVTDAWERTAAEREREGLRKFLEEVAETDTIKAAMKLALAALQLEAGARVLDIGCGTGAFLPGLAKVLDGSGVMVGLDHASGFLADAGSLAESGSFAESLVLVQADAHFLPFSEASFAGVHTERVLIHLRDPEQALREMFRVVQPGGWVVCVEPDLTGMRLDVDEEMDEDRLIEAFCNTIRNPGMGLELNRRMAIAGFEERTVKVLTEVEHAFPLDSITIFERAGEHAIENGWMTRERVVRLLAGMKQASERGTLTSYACMFVVAGRKPIVGDTGG